MIDKRAFAQFDVGYLDNPKVSDVFDTSPLAICMHFASVLYCAQHLTDGFIALRSMQRKVGAADDDTRLLIDAGLWHEAGHTCEWCPQVPAGRLYVHDYTKHNRTSEAVKGRSKAAQIGARARWEAKESDANRMQNASGSQSSSQSDESENAMPRERERERERSSSPGEAKKPETKLPKDWAPTAAHIERAKERGIDLMLQAESFKLHAETHDRRAANWNAAFTTWLIKAPASQRPMGNVPTQYAWANQ